MSKKSNVSNKEKIRLTLGTFLSILGVASVENELSNQDQSKSFRALCKIVDPTFSDPSNYQRATLSLFKRCGSGSLTNCPLCSVDKRKLFLKRYSDDYASVLSDINSYLDEHVIDTRFNWLGSAIIDTVSKDDQLKGPIIVDGKEITKEELCSQNRLDKIIGGVINYLLSNDIKNTDGQETIKKWSIPNDRYNKDHYETENKKSKVSKDLIFPQEKVTKEFQKGASTKNRKITANKSKEADIFSNYIQSIIGDPLERPSFFDRTIRTKFEDTYVCNNVMLTRFADFKQKNNFRPIRDISREKVIKYTKKLIITGSGGMGKTSMLVYLNKQTAIG